MRPNSSLVRRSAAACLSVAVLGGAAWAAETPPGPLEQDGWTLITASEQTLVYMKPAPSPDRALKRAWTAYDSAIKRDRSGFTFMSVQALGEFDCRRKSARVLDETFHDGRALQGRSWKMPGFVPTPWAPVAPDSVGAVRLAFVCMGDEV
ncbi:surface-adhesin E family protein [Phenylobacterium sp.]|uniref:surface-adhesin E family protein n=1 Tax=Phenylobacterium sp. TaxID=1871053 RepID=UPI002DF3D6DD|nr:surface-adhesin E family protein [Phenylobacterium sp.]